MVPCIKLDYEKNVIIASGFLLLFKLEIIWIVEKLVLFFIYTP